MCDFKNDIVAYALLCSAAILVHDAQRRVQHHVAKKMTIICYAKPTDKRVDTNEEKTKKEQIVGGKEGLKGATSEQKDRIYSSMERITNLLMETIECL